MKPTGRNYKEIPLEIVGSTKFGRYPKMSSEETFNMIISDDWLVPFAGYKNVLEIDNKGQGRGIYSSVKLKKMFLVINNDVYMVDSALNKKQIGVIDTFSGDIFISENNVGQIIISDLINLYIYDSNITTSVVTKVPVTFAPGYVTFQNGRFITSAKDGSVDFEWRTSELNNGNSWPSTANFVGALQTKPDKTVGAVRFPGRGNLLLVFGETVTEQWYDVGAQLFPYQKNQSANIDYGCINPATIAEGENFVAWVAINEKSGPVISFTNGGDIQHISTDGIDFRLANLKNPKNCYGFMFKQDGHLLYVTTWPDDNITYMYDFNTQRFFSLCDEDRDFFAAKRVVLFNNKYYFVSFRDGNLYELSSLYQTYDYGNFEIHEIPRIRIVPSIRLPDQSRFICGYTGFTVEQGHIDYEQFDTLFNFVTEDYNPIVTENYVEIGGGFSYVDNLPVVFMSMSKDGGVAFGAESAKVLNPLGKRQNRLVWWQQGQANDLVFQFRFYGFGRFVATNGLSGIHL